MKVLYLLAGNYFNNNTIGIANKIKAKITAFNREGLETDLMIYAVEDPGLIFDFRCIYEKASTNSDFYKNLSNIMPHLVQQYEVILTRYPFADRYFCDFVKRFPRTFVFEHNTIEENEALLLQKRHLSTIKVSLSPSYLRYFFRTHVLKQTSELVYGPLVLNAAKAGVAVTHEIQQYEQGRCKTYRMATISNGVNTDLIEPVKIKPIANEVNCFMLIGTYAPWHGIDRIIKGLNQYRGAYKINVHFFGLKERDIDVSLSNSAAKIICHQKIGQAGLKTSMSNMHFAFSSLAMHRIQLKEAAPLKLRESMLHGFPVVLGYKDVDISESETLSKFSLQVKPNDSAIDFDEIIKFIKNTQAVNDYNLVINAAAKKQFGFEAKAKQYLAFFKQLQQEKAMSLEA